MIELRDVYKTYERNNEGIEALRGVSLKVEKGDIFGVIGYSGAGKSTLIRMVNGLERPTRGEVLVDGRALSGITGRELRQLRQSIGMIFQHFNLLETKTVFENVAMPLVLTGKKRHEIRERTEELLEYVGLSNKARSYPKELSGGQKQRVGIARALANNPRILLCDEATSALDPQTTLSILELLRRINREYNITIMLITHEMGVIQKICNKVAVMEKGQIIEQGNVIDVFGNPEHPTTRSFVESVIQTTVPPSILQSVEDVHRGRMFKLKFVGKLASEPVIHDLIRRFPVEVNTLFATMTEIQQTMLGYMIIRMDGRPEDIEQAARHVAERGVLIEEVRVP